jgi:hypothetical protein
VLWVVEAKDFTMPFSARSIRNELRKYYRANGHEWKLGKSALISPLTRTRLRSIWGHPQ